MASVFLELNDTGVVVANDNEKVFGQQGHEGIIVLAGVTGVTLDQNLEQITLSGDTADYAFEQQGNQLHILDGGSRVVSFPVQPDDDGTRLMFDNGAAYDAVFVDGTIVLEDVTDPDPGDDNDTLQADAFDRSVTIAGIDHDSLIGMTGGPAGNRFVDNIADNHLSGGTGDDLFYLGAGGFDRISGNGGHDLVMLEEYASGQVEMGEHGDAFLLVAEGFAVEMVDIAGVQFADQLYVV
jgi:hypothetical protein